MSIFNNRMRVAISLAVLVIAAPKIAAAQSPKPKTTATEDNCQEPWKPARTCEADCDKKFDWSKTKEKYKACKTACFAEAKALMEKCVKKEQADLEADPCHKASYPRLQSCSTSCDSTPDSLSCTASCRRTYDAEVTRCHAAPPK